MLKISTLTAQGFPTAPTTYHHADVNMSASHSHLFTNNNNG